MFQIHIRKSKVSSLSLGDSNSNKFSIKHSYKNTNNYNSELESEFFEFRNISFLTESGNLIFVKIISVYKKETQITKKVKGLQH